MNGYPTREQVERIKERYPEGQRVELVSIDDPYTKLQPGTQGTVSNVDSIGTVHISWDCGSQLGIVIGEDEIRKI